mmetsp:Transcript_8473/g.13783  ORF Transcript_8473/g.13783 Transcript_8473/m.13783 type:complete len:84 (+) Transcript_8473:493-744(+)
MDVKALRSSSDDKLPAPSLSNGAKAESQLSFCPINRRRIREAISRTADCGANGGGPCGGAGAPSGGRGEGGFGLSGFGRSEAA